MAKYYKVLVLCISNIDEFEALVKLESQSDNINGPASLKKLTLGIQLLQNLPKDTAVLQNLLNGRKLLQNYRREQKHWLVSHPIHPAVSPFMVLPFISLFQDNYQWHGRRA